MISPETIDKIMDAIRIEEVVGEYVQLKKRGVNLIGLCPFHNEKTPSFTVSAPKSIYKCFGCGKGGNAVNFLMDHEHFSYPEALRHLANKYGIDIEEEKTTPEQQLAKDEKESLFNLSAFAQKYFHETLLESEEGRSVGLSYLKERGYTLETIRKFQLGYCRNKWDDFSTHALKHGYKKEYLIKTSLSKSKDHQIYDTFRGRVMFPIHNLSGRILGFGGRILTNDKNRPKYINSAESDIYHKGKVLYGIFFAKSPMAAEDNCYMVEGYTDVISLHQAGITNTIATSGTALTSDQIKLIRRYTTNVTLLFDGDPAGIKAAFRSIDMILEEGLNVRLVLFPDGEDPDSFARKKRASEVRDFLTNESKDFISFKTDLLLNETLGDPIKKASLIKEIAQSISLIPEPIARTLYVQQCAQKMQVEEQLMATEVGRLRRQKKVGTAAGGSRLNQEEQIIQVTPPKTQEGADKIEQSNSHGQEKEIIRLLLLYGGEELEFTVQEKGRPTETIHLKVAEMLVRDIQEDQLSFDGPHCQEIFTIFADNIKNDKLPSNASLINHPDPSLRQLVVDLMSVRHHLSRNWETRHRIFVTEEIEELKPRVLQAIYSFKLRKLEQMITENQEMIRKSSAQPPSDADPIDSLLKVQQDLQSKRSVFAAALNRVITK